MDQMKNQEITIVMGVLNAKVDNGRENNVVGPFGLCERNDRGDRCVGL